jgi:hypothetical protein
MRQQFLPPILLSLALLLAACTGTAPEQDSAGTPVQITVETRPSPAAMGPVTIILTITDAQGRPLEGASVDVSADHTDMSGMSMGGPATEQSPGKYAISADFTMSGNWMLRVYVRSGEIDYKEDIPLVLK